MVLGEWFVSKLDPTFLIIFVPNKTLGRYHLDRDSTFTF